MTFSVIIPTYNDWDRLEKCVSKLIESAKNHRLEYEIIVVDNASSHQPPESIKKLDKVKWVYEATPGSYAARNSGARAATGRYLAFTDSDCVPEEDWLINAGNLFDQEDCDLIGGRIDLFRVENSSQFAYIYEKHTAFLQSKNVPRGNAVTANLFIKRDLFEKLGGFNADLKSGGDWEFSQKAVQAGYQLVYSNEVRVLHPARKTVRSVFKKQRRFAAWGYLNVQRKYGHSGIRILLSNLYHGIFSVINKTKRPALFNEKLIIFSISSALYLYKSMLHFAILIHIWNPKNVRE